MYIMKKERQICEILVSKLNLDELNKKRETFSLSTRVMVV